MDPWPCLIEAVQCNGNDRFKEYVEQILTWQPCRVFAISFYLYEENVNVKVKYAALRAILPTF